MSDSNDIDLPAYFGVLLALLFIGGAIFGVVHDGFHVNAIITWSFMVAFIGFCSACLLAAAGYVLLGVGIFLCAFLWEIVIKPLCFGWSWLYRLVTD